MTRESLNHFLGVKTGLRNEVVFGVDKRFGHSKCLARKDMLLLPACIPERSNFDFQGSGLFLAAFIRAFQVVMRMWGD